MKLKIPGFLISAVFSVSICGPLTPLTDSEKLLREIEIPLTVGVFQDERLPALQKSDIRVIFKEAEEMLHRKLGYVPVRFKLQRRGRLVDLFEEVKADDSRFENWLEDFKPMISEPVKIWKDRMYNQRAEMIPFLKKYWSLEALSKYRKVSSYEKFLAEMLPVYVKKLKYLKNYRLTSGPRKGQLLISENPVHHSYLAWSALMNYQSRYDLILTNTILAYDNITEPYPHVVFKHAKVSGGSFESPERRGYLAGSSSMSSVFELYSNEPYFQGERTRQANLLSREYINRALGGYLLAHEMGHQIYWIPDFYQQPNDCLMNTGFENMEIGDGYRQLIKGRSACSEYRPYVQARNLLFIGSWYAKKGRMQAAQEYIERGLDMLPEKLDRSHEIVKSYYRKVLDD